TYTGPNEQAKTPAAACAPDATHPAATMSNLVQSGGSFELICTYPASGDQWLVTRTSGDQELGAVQINTPGQSLPAVAKNAVNLNGLETGGPGNADLVSSGWGRAGADVTNVTLITQAGEKIPAKVQNGFWTAVWQSGSNPMETRYATLTWTTAGGASYTAAGDKVSGTNGLKVPSGTSSTAPAPAR
ncbi:MAG: hypothetical protein ACRDNO_32825, partial [Trebonia sp.]